MWRWICLVPISACSFHPGDTTDARVVDGQDSRVIDTMLLEGMPDCYGPASVRICFAQSPMTPNVIATAITIDDTSTDPSCATYDSPSHTDACVIAGSSISIDEVVVARGPRPLIFVSPGDITLTGKIDVSSTDTIIGAAGNGTCNIATDPSMEVGHTAGGGSGGSFGGGGGNGGNGGNGGVGSTAALTLSLPTVPRGGCQGIGGGGNGFGNAGNGGGAVMLISRGTIHIDGAITASGGGGIGATASAKSGGGGGGSGGMIWLEAEAVALAKNGVVFANGGGGGEGSSDATSGNPGLGSPGPDSPGTGGGSNSPTGGDGGDGSYGATLAGVAGSVGTTGGGHEGGGGGGGGGAGFIIIHGTPSGPTTNPKNVAPPAS